ncbi:hypothetical protein [Polaromonas sp. YR568]|uniref:hypothetical protein n=1 Tax=Polaromonas sp. YR568 TaxID=1855301 RepID=UPI00398C0D39
MLTKNQWLWCAEHQKQIRTTTIVVFSIFLLTYCYVFFERFFWNNKIPIQFHPEISQMAKLNCYTEDVGGMFIPSVQKKRELQGDLRNYVPDPLERSDARFVLLENYFTSVIGSEILEKRPECLGAYIADKQQYPEPYALLVVDRGTGKTVFRIARLQDYLTR